MSIVIIIQARMSSTRLPGKVLMPLLGKPMLERQIERIQRAKQFDKLVVATSTDTSDDVIEALSNKLAVDCFRGSLNDVLSRYYHAATQFNASHIVRITADCPVIDPDVIDELIAFHLQTGADYTTNNFIHSFPHGLDVEVFSMPALEQAHLNANKPSEREHVSPYIRNHPDMFQLKNLLSQHEAVGDIRLTVDHQEDFELITRIYSALYNKSPNFTLDDILRLLSKNISWLMLNAHIDRNEGVKKSLKDDFEQGFN